MGIPSLFPDCFVCTGLMPPQSSAAPMGSNATFQCIAATGLIIWSVNNIQVSSPSLQQFFATHGIFIPLERRNNSTVMILATPMNNGTRLTCLVGEFAVVCRSDPVTLWGDELEGLSSVSCRHVKGLLPPGFCLWPQLVLPSAGSGIDKY